MKKLSDFIFCKLFEKFFTAWFFASAIIMTLYPDSISLENTNETGFITVFFAVFILISCIEHKHSGTVQAVLIFAVLIFSMLFLINSNNIYTFLPLAVFYCITVHHYFNKKQELNTELPKKQMLFIIILCAVFFFSVVTAVSILRYITYSAPNFDFGIFCNMYHNMKNTFLPTVSCERDQILSHFAVHFSPALYIFLPVYFIFPSPITVAVCQTVAIYSAVIPFILIMKHRKLPTVNIVFLSVVFLASAAFAKGCAYDFHENCLLPPFLMWMFYFYEKKKTIPVFLFAFLTLMVKEDAFIYVSVFAVFIIIANKDFKKGSFLIAIAIAYFIGACAYLENFGTGIMSNRYDAMISEDDGLLGIIKTVLLNPAYAIEQIFGTTENDPEKIIYFLEIMSPLAFIPFFTKKPARLILVLPILLNLLTDYAYQYNINFQYSFGITTLLLYASLMNIQEMERKKRDFACVTAAGLAVMMFVMLMTPSVAEFTGKYIENKEMHEEIDEVLETIPQDASVTASTFFIPHLSDRTEIYEAYYREKTDTDYVVLDMRDNQINDSRKISLKYELAGYKPVDSGSEYVAIFKKQ